MRDSVLFYRSFWDAVRGLPPEQFKPAVAAIMEYGLNELAPETSGIEQTIYALVKPQIDANNRKYLNGTKGGRPKSTEQPRQNQDVTEQEPNQNQKITKPKPTYNQTETKPEPKVKVKEKDKVKDIKEILSGTSADRPPSGTSIEDETKYPYKAVIDYLNQKAGTSFRSSSKDNRKHIKARVDDGFRLEDFCEVIDKKVSEWGREPAAGEKDMRQYLRPMTLFGPKFESYLNQKPVAAAVSKNKFNNFDQRQYDHASLERQLLAKRGLLREGDH